MAIDAFLGQSAENAIGVALIARHEPMRARELKTGLLMSKQRGHPTDLPMASITPIPQRIHVGVGVARDALHWLGSHGGFRVMAHLAFQKVVFAAQRKFAEIMEFPRGLEAAGVMAPLAVFTKIPIVNVPVAIDAFHEADFVTIVDVALVALGLEVLTGELETGPTVMVEIHGPKAGGGVAARALIAELIFMEIVVAPFAISGGSFVFSLFVAAFTFGLFVLADQRETGIPVMVEGILFKPFGIVTGGA